MKVFLVGVACVGKTTVGALLAERLRCPFFDADEVIEEHFGKPIERLQGQFLTEYSYRKDTSVAIKRLVAEANDFVIALPPSGLRDAYWRIVKNVSCATVVLEDSPANILSRITFYDVDSQRIDRHLSEHERALYLKDIKADISFFGKYYKRAHLHADISNLDPEQSAEKIHRMLIEHRSLQRGSR